VAQLVETMAVGGAENLAVRFANALQQRGFVSHLIVMGEPGPLSSRIDEAVQIHYLRFERASIKNPLAFLISIASGLRRLKKVCRDESISLVQSHLPGANFWALLLSLLGLSSTLATIHNNQEFKYGESDSPVRVRLRKWAYKAIVARCSGTVAVSGKVKDSLVLDLNLGHDQVDRISVVTNGVSLPAIPGHDARAVIREEMGVDPQTPLILAAGRFEAQKNFGDLVAIAALLKDNGVDFKLIIAGDGDMRPTLESRVGELGLSGKVVLPGNVPQLNRWMLGADIFVMTSLWEGLPLVLLEAMAAGLPGVAFDIAGVNELVTEGGNGHLIPVGNRKLFATKLGEMLGNAMARQEMGARSRDRITRDFNFETLMDKLEALYRGVLSQASR
jgi:glycosyltransferase involved in cell wall biosynthesis